MKLPTTKTVCPACRGTGKVLDAKALGEALRKRREEAGLSLRDLARRLSISPTHASDVERGHRAPSAPVLEAWLRVF